MAWVKRLQVFAQFHMAADIIITFALSTILAYATQATLNTGGFSNDVRMINPSTYLSFIGTSIFAFEGIGVILPVKDTCKDTKSYTFIVVLVLIVSSMLYIMFGSYNYFVYGEEQLKPAPLVTKILPQDSIIVQVTVTAYIFSSLISYPLILYPANMVIESYLFKGMKSSSLSKKYLYTLNRTILVGITVILSLTLEETLDKLMSVVGSLACTPVSYTLPAAFHLKLVAETTWEKALDWFIILSSLFLMVFLTGFTFMTWNE